MRRRVQRKNATHSDPVMGAWDRGIEANIDEAYSRISGKDRALEFEYALGEVRESMSWYKGAKPVLGEEITKDRRNRLEEIRRLLLAIIPRERGKTMK